MSINKCENDSNYFDFSHCPQEDAACVRYSMAIASRFLYFNNTKPTTANPIFIPCADWERENKFLMIESDFTPVRQLYLWTAFMIFGTSSAGYKYGSKAIRFESRNFDVEKELGYFSTFSQTSLYETVFKHYLTEDMLIIQKSPQAFEGKPYKTFEECEHFKEREKEAFEKKRKEKERIRSETRTKEKEIYDKQAEIYEKHRRQREEDERRLAMLEKEHKDLEKERARAKAAKRREEEVKRKEEEAKREETVRVHEELKRKIALQLRGIQCANQLSLKSNAEKIIQESRALYNYYHNSEIFHKRATVISSYLSDGADIDYQMPYDKEKGPTLLMRVVDDDNARLAEYLLKQGADPLIKFKNREIASDFASTESSIYWLLKNYELLRATINNDLNTVKKTLKAGADINFQGANGYSALLIAVHLNYIDLVEYLLLQEANILLTLPDGEDIFNLASSEEVCNLLSMVTTYYDNTKDGNNSATNNHNFFNSNNNQTSNNSL